MTHRRGVVVRGSERCWSEGDELESHQSRRVFFSLTDFYTHCWQWTQWEGWAYVSTVGTLFKGTVR